MPITRRFGLPTCADILGIGDSQLPLTLSPGSDEGSSNLPVSLDPSTGEGIIAICDVVSEVVDLAR